MIDFPSFLDAPAQLHHLEANCGVLVAWGALRYFHKRASVTHLIKACRHTKRHGVFTIALALALKEHGLNISFHSDPDPAPERTERKCYRMAEELGITTSSGMGLDEVLSKVTPATIPIVLYETDSGNGHFSPVFGLLDGYVYLPYAETDETRRISHEKLESKRVALGIFRQCVIVSRSGSE